MLQLLDRIFDAGTCAHLTVAQAEPLADGLLFFLLRSVPVEELKYEALQLPVDMATQLLERLYAVDDAGRRYDKRLSAVDAGSRRQVVVPPGTIARI